MEVLAVGQEPHFRQPELSRMGAVLGGGAAGMGQGIVLGMELPFNDPRPMISDAGFAHVPVAEAGCTSREGYFLCCLHTKGRKNKPK